MPKHTAVSEYSGHTVFVIDTVLSLHIETVKGFSIHDVFFIFLSCSDGIWL